MNIKRLRAFFILLISTTNIFSDQAQHLTTTPSMQPIVIDSIKSVVYGSEGTEIITESDLKRPGLAGNMRILDDLIFERAVYLDAKKMKMAGDDDAVDKYLNAIARDNNLSLFDIENMFAEIGYSLAEGREQLQLMYAFNNVVDFKVRSNLIVPRKQINAYYEDNPVWKDARYYISYASIVIPSGNNKKSIEREIQRYIRTGKATGIKIMWSEPFWIEEEDIADDKKFITQMQKDDIKGPIDKNNYFELYKIVDIEPRRLLTLEERYQDIVNILRRPLFEEKMSDYKAKLFNGLSIVYF